MGGLCPCWLLASSFGSQPPVGSLRPLFLCLSEGHSFKWFFALSGWFSNGCLFSARTGGSAFWNEDMDLVGAFTTVKTGSKDGSDGVLSLTICWPSERPWPQD